MQALKCALLMLLFLVSAPGTASADEALVIPLDGAIGPASAEMVAHGIRAAQERNARLVILRMDTPGGLDGSMRRIIKSLLGSPIPVAVYVAPSGARAASAGTYILYAAHVAAMAPATNLGAATPVEIGGMPDMGETPKPPGDGDEEDGKPKESAKERKLVNDAVAYLRGLAELRGRNADWAEQAVRESVSLQASAAKEQGVVDLIADDIPQLLDAMHGMEVVLVHGQRLTLDTRGLSVHLLEPGWRARLLSVITNPNVAYILLMIGIYGLILEMYNPGALLPGVAGAVSLLLALYALQLLPVNYAGLGLILLGVALMIGEAFAPSFGILGFGGLVAFLFGSVMLLDGDGLRVSLPIIGITAGISATLSIWVLSRLLSLRRKAVVSGSQTLVGRPARALEDFAQLGRVRVEGEIWQASAAGPIRRGQRLRVLRVDGLRLEVEPDEQESEHEL